MLLRWPRPFYSAEGGTGGGGDTSSASTGGGEGEGAQTPTAPAGLESFWDTEKGSLKVEDLAKSFGELNTFKAEYDTRLAALPQKPEDVQLTLPEGFQAPEGVEIKFDEADPRVAAFRQFAVENKLPQSAVSALLAMEAQRTIDAETKQLESYEADAKAEKAKLGENADQRVSVVEGFLKSNLSESQYNALRVVTVNAAAVEAVEKLIELANGGTLPGAGANTSTAAKPDLASRLFPSMKN